MEAELLSTLDAIANQDGVKGVLLADNMGFCLGARGIAKSQAAAFAASIADTVREFLSDQTEPENKSQYPTVHIEYEHTRVVIRNEGTFTLAIFSDL